MAATQRPSRIPNAPPDTCALTSTPSGVPTTAAAMRTSAMRWVSRPRSWPERAKAAVPSAALPTFVAIAVPLIAAGGRPERRNSPIVTSTPPGPSAVVPTPPANPNSARMTSVPAARWSALWVSPAAANAITRRGPVDAEGGRPAARARAVCKISPHTALNLTHVRPRSCAPGHPPNLRSRPRGALPTMTT